MILEDSVSINRPIAERVLWAESFFREYGTLFFENEKITALLRTFRAATEEATRTMDGIGVVDLCRKCDLEEGGSCCGRGLENKYDGWLLLINRLLQVSLPLARQQPEGCLFLGEEGCLLKARHVICINYMCRKITENIQPAALGTLREMEGREIDTLFILKEAVKGLVKEWRKTQETS